MLRSDIIVLTKSGAARPGFVDQWGQVYLPPKSTKKLDHWKRKMVETRGVQFVKGES